jgi:hypothetical protein
LTLHSPLQPPALISLMQCFSTFFERGTLFFVVSPRGTLTYEATTLRETRACTRSLPSAVVCELSELQSDRTLQLKYGEPSLLKFWILAEEYPEIIVEAVNTLLHFSTTYLCELGFSALTNIKNKKRERLLSLQQEMRVFVLNSTTN